MVITHDSQPPTQSGCEWRKTHTRTRVPAKDFRTASIDESNSCKCMLHCRRQLTAALAILLARLGSASKSTSAVLRCDSGTRAGGSGKGRSSDSSIRPLRNVYGDVSAYLSSSRTMLVHRVDTVTTTGQHVIDDAKHYELQRSVDLVTRRCLTVVTI